MSERAMCLVVDHRVEMPEQHHPAFAGSAQPADHVESVVRRRTLHALDLCLGRQKRGRERDALLRALDVARGRRHGHERLQLALGGERHAGGRLDHSSGAWKW
jgi:hypothetical protein